jgi:hypothetical protein
MRRGCKNKKLRPSTTKESRKVTPGAETAHVKRASCRVIRADLVRAERDEHFLANRHKIKVREVSVCGFDMHQKLDWNFGFCTFSLVDYFSSGHSF